MKRSILALVGSVCLIAPILVKAVAYTHFVTPNGSATQPVHTAGAVQPGASGQPDREREHAARQHRARAARRRRHLLAGGADVRGQRRRRQPDQVHRRKRRADHRRHASSLPPTSLDAGARAGNIPINSTGTKRRSSPLCQPSAPRCRTGGRSGSRTGGRRLRRHRIDVSIMWFPPLYSARTSINEVEAQAGTAWNDTANNKVYVHLFDDTAPPRDGTNLYLASSRLGHTDHQRRLPLAGESDHRTRDTRGPSGQYLRDGNRPQTNHRSGDDRQPAGRQHARRGS